MSNMFISNLRAWIVAPDSSRSGGAQAVIPYRTEMPISAGSIAFSVSVTVLVLVALVAAIVYARHRGWTGRLAAGMISGKRAAPDESIEVRATRRVSIATIAHVVASRGHEYLIVESTRGSTAAVTSLGSSRAELGKGP